MCDGTTAWAIMLAPICSLSFSWREVLKHHRDDEKQENVLGTVRQRRTGPPGQPALSKPMAAAT